MNGIHKINFIQRAMFKKCSFFLSVAQIFKKNIMKKSTFDDYISRFNAQDMTTFDDYIAPNMKMINGTLEYEGVQGMKDHYAKIWGRFSEQLTVQKFIGNQKNVAIQMWAHFTALVDDENSIFGSVKSGETFDFRGLIMYELVDGKFLNS